MKYHCEENCDSAKALSIVAVVAGVLGLAYYGYRKRDAIDWERMHRFNHRVKHVFDPLRRGTRESADRASELARDTKESVQDSFNNVFSSLDARIDKLQGDAKDTYQHEVQELRNKLDRLLQDAQQDTQ